MSGSELTDVEVEAYYSMYDCREEGVMTAILDILMWVKGIGMTVGMIIGIYWWRKAFSNHLVIGFLFVPCVIIVGQRIHYQVI